MIMFCMWLLELFLKKFKQFETNFVNNSHIMLDFVLNECFCKEGIGFIKRNQEKGDYSKSKPKGL